MDGNQLSSELVSLQGLTLTVLEMLDYQTKVLGISGNCISKGSELVKTATCSIQELHKLLAENERKAHDQSVDELESLDCDVDDGSDGLHSATHRGDELAGSGEKKVVGHEVKAELITLHAVKQEPGESNPNASKDIFEEFDEDDDVDLNMLAVSNYFFFPGCWLLTQSL